MQGTLDPEALLLLVGGAGPAPAHQPLDQNANGALQPPALDMALQLSNGMLPSTQQILPLQGTHVMHAALQGLERAAESASSDDSAGGGVRQATHAAQPAEPHLVPTKRARSRAARTATEEAGAQRLCKIDGCGAELNRSQGRKGGNSCWIAGLCPEHLHTRFPDRHKLGSDISEEWEMFCTHCGSRKGREHFPPGHLTCVRKHGATNKRGKRRGRDEEERASSPPLAGQRRAQVAPGTLTPCTFAPLSATNSLCGASEASSVAAESTVLVAVGQPALPALDCARGHAGLRLDGPGGHVTMVPSAASIGGARAMATGVSGADQHLIVHAAQQPVHDEALWAAGLAAGPLMGDVLGPPWQLLLKPDGGGGSARNHVSVGLLDEPLLFAQPTPTAVGGAVLLDALGVMPAW